MTYKRRNGKGREEIGGPTWKKGLEKVFELYNDP